MNNEVWKLDINDKGIAYLTLDIPDEKVNILSLDILWQLDQILENIKNQHQVKALVIKSGKKDSFIAGANLHEFEKGFNDPSFPAKAIHLGHEVFGKLANLPFPTIALIHGVCLGGGLELALACRYRLVSDHPKTQLGLPETTIGIFPGWGGTQRLPRLIGLIEGVQMIISGRPVNGIKAVKIKLADKLFPQEFADERLEEFLNQCLTEKGRKEIEDKRKLKGWQNLLIESNPLGQYYFFYRAKKEILSKTKGHYPAPPMALQVIEETYSLPINKGLEREKAVFIESLPRLAPIAKHLIHLFFVQENLKKVTGAPAETVPLSVANIGVVGAGTMGIGISYICSNAGFPVRLKDVNWDILGRALGSIHKIYEKLVSKRKLKSYEVNLKMHLVTPTTDYKGFKHVNLAMEVATENLELKHLIFQELEDCISEKAMITSNTSSLTIAEMSQNMKHPERFVGMHFFNPTERMPLVEIVPGKSTAPEVVAGAMDFCRKLGKTPIIVQDCSGFLVNRIFVLGANEVIWMLQEGVPMKKLEDVLLNFGLPMSPFEVGDEVGNDVSYKVSTIFEKAYGERMAPPPLLKAMYDQKFFGKKVSKGFYIYKGKHKLENPDIKRLLKSYPKQTRDISDKEIIERVLYLMINEAWRCLQEHIVDNEDTIDLALIMGTGFPPFRGGLMQYANEVGVEKIVERLKYYEGLYGPRFTPVK